METMGLLRPKSSLSLDSKPPSHRSIEGPPVVVTSPVLQTTSLTSSPVPVWTKTNVRSVRGSLQVSLGSLESFPNKDTSTHPIPGTRNPVYSRPYKSTGYVTYLEKIVRVVSHTRTSTFVTKVSGGGCVYSTQPLCSVSLQCHRRRHFTCTITYK